ncbi:helix-turn-helix domain-containing protein [Pedobacter jeongneungensis]|uniref:helix-turn-helix domain-containing protein n=1 Tax=Pedobacter jeongneungensis TaxID=947309 RepID=UPI00046AE02B|nr:helix-turn-helix transcriptional regulator [Pedobacter jeongneungensis]
MEGIINKATHLGYKVERIRRMKSISQETLASSLGMTRQNLSRLEHAEVIDDDKLEQIAQQLGVSKEDIKNFNEDAMFNNFVHNNETVSVFNHISNYQLYPSEKINELVDTLIKSMQEKTELYEALLKSEREKNEILKKQLMEKG